MYICENEKYMKGMIPIGFSDFREIIERGFRYIDKTRYVHTLCTTGKYYFLSRPRRFGKSLHISLIKELYSGSKSLFEGLWIFDQWDWVNIHPVIHFTFNGIDLDEQELDKSLHQLLDIEYDKYKLPQNDFPLGIKLSQLILNLALKSKVVILIDEYDAPITHFLGKDYKKALKNRGILKNLFSVLKNEDAHLEFVMLTGVSRFSKVGIFSGLNNLWDISTEKQFSSMLGYTQTELEENFEYEIEECCKELKKIQIST